MYEIPMEGSAAGNAMALMLLVAPLLAAILGYVQRPSLRAFFLAMLAGCSVIAFGTFYAVSAAPGKGTLWLAGGLAVWGVLLSMLTAGVTVGARAIGVPKIASPAEADDPAAKEERSSSGEPEDASASLKRR